MKAALAEKLTNRDGVWFPSLETGAVSYSQSGHDECFEVEDGSFWFQVRNNVILSVLKKYPPRGYLLDVGGGNGFVSSYLQESKVDVVLVEPGLAGAQNALKRGVEHVICSRFEDLQAADASIPAVGLFDVIEHLEEDGPFLACLFNKLSKDGRVYITVPAYKFLWSDHDERAGHFRRYTEKSLAEALEQAGFTVEFSSYFFAPLPLFIFLGRVFKEKILAKHTKTHHEQKRAEHGNKLAGKIFRLLCLLDLAMIKNGLPLAFGSSLILVAKKVQLD